MNRNPYLRVRHFKLNQLSIVGHSVRPYYVRRSRIVYQGGWRNGCWRFRRCYRHGWVGLILYSTSCLYDYVGIINKILSLLKAMLVRHKQLCLVGQDESPYFRLIKCREFKAQSQKVQNEWALLYFLEISREFCFRLIFAVGAEPRKISARNFLTTCKPWLHGICFHLHMCGFLDTVHPDDYSIIPTKLSISTIDKAILRNCIVVSRPTSVSKATRAGGKKFTPHPQSTPILLELVHFVFSC